jgi:putative acetyltransferase
MNTPTLRLATYPADTAPLVALIREYLTWLNVDLCGRGLEKELPQFETLFTPPSGLFVLAHVGSELAGCAGLLVHHGRSAELKRVYVRPAHRGLNLGEALVRRLMELAPTLNVNHLILDAVAPTTHAQALYRRMGFTETQPYYANPEHNTLFFEFHLPPSPETTPPCSS